MAVIGVRGQGKRPQRTDGVMLGVPFRGQIVQKSWPPHKKYNKSQKELGRLARMRVIEWLGKFLSPCQHQSLHDAAKALHMLPRDLWYQTASNRMFAPVDRYGHIIWPKQVVADYESAISAFGTADNQLLTRGQYLWSHTPAARPYDACVWLEAKQTVLFSTTVA
jgi:hypothetical protein